MHNRRHLLDEVNITKVQQHELRRDCIDLAKYCRDLKILSNDTKMLLDMHEIDLNDAEKQSETAAKHVKEVSRSYSRFKNATVSIVFGFLGMVTLGPLGCVLGGALGALGGIGSGAAVGVIHYQCS